MNDLTPIAESTVQASEDHITKGGAGTDGWGPRTTTIKPNPRPNPVKNGP